jgi:hypothetical protein
MEMNANLELSKKEYDVIINSDFILTKNRIIEKMCALYGVLSDAYKIELNKYTSCLPNGIFETPPKIYKGEQYKNLPYVMLDYPRCFSKTNVFAIRSFFWWGNYFSITLHISGNYFKMFADKISSFIKDEKNKDWFFGINESEWEHHFEKNNYILFDEVKTMNESNFKNRQFIKIANKLPLENWQSATNFYLMHYTALLKMLCED